MRVGLFTWLLCSFGMVAPTAAQCLVTDFSLPATACREEQINLSNLSAPGTSAWDFCSGDFGVTPAAQAAWTLPAVNGRPGIEFAFDTKWYAFVTGTFTNSLYRLEFDGGLAAAPTAVTNVGTLGGAVNQPGQIRLAKEGASWFGVLLNTGGELVRLSFGSQLSNTPTAVSLISGVGYFHSGLAMGRDPVHGYVAVVTDDSNDAVVIRLGTTFAIPNPVTDVLRSAVVANPNNIGDIDLISVCGNWYAFANNFGNGNLYRFDFGASLYSVPTITQIGTTIAANPGRIRVVSEGDAYFMFMMENDGDLVKGEMGTSIVSTPTITNQGTLSGVLTPSMYAIGMVKENSTWTTLGINQGNGQFFRVNYADNCSANPRTSLAANPSIAYVSAGTYQVSLNNSSGSNNGVKTRSITVSSNVAPDITFTTSGACAGFGVQFSPVNSSGNITGYSWAFDDGQFSASPSPSHAYASAGNYTPHVTVTASNGCSNSASQSLAVYAAPVSDFNLPSTSPICTNQSYLFDNTSVIDPGSTPAWEWRLDGVLVSGLEDLQTTFTSATPKEIRLKVLIPGCENEMVKNIATVVTGPLVDFNAPDNCAGTLVPFTNTTTGADAGVSWNFGDGSPASTLTQPSHTYASAGTFTVTLTANNVAGCSNFRAKDVVIYTVPQPDFSVGLPPFSCSNAPTLFQNNTPALTDSNITGWLWEFGDPAASTATSRDPSFTYTAGGNYTVNLTATSDAGCSHSVSKLVTIGTSPIADFVNSPACVNQGTQFSDISAGGVQSRTWQINGSLFTSPNPMYTFTSSGNYNVTLTVTAPGGCNDAITKPITVPLLPTLVMNAENTCANQTTTFTLLDTSMPVNDAVVGWQWNIAGTTTTGNPATGIITLPGLAPVSVTTTHASGCVYTQTKQINIHPSPVASFTATPDRGDAPLTVQFQNQSTGAIQYQWVFAGNPPGLSTEVSPLYTFLTLGDYSAELTVVNADGCSDVKTIPIQVLTPTVDLVLTAFTLSPDGLTGKLKPTVTILNNSNIPVSAVEMAIHLSNLASVTESIVVDLAVGASTTKTLTVSVDPQQFEAAFVCAEVLSEKDVVAADNKQCISYSDTDYVFDPYPNPVSGYLYIDWVSEKSGTAVVSIYNSQGRREYEWQTPSAAGLNQSMHDLSFMAPGIYFVTVQTSTSIQTRRIVRL